jgi:type I restriction-modification system DNA methylase subunit
MPRKFIDREGITMPAPQIILDLMERFERNIDAYKSGSYNETQVRREFIDPFFEALGWDINNIQGNAEAYKDVVHEDAVKVGGVTKAPDYSFRIGGQRKFFVEAKKPSINIKEAPAAAFQLRRYAWSAKLALSIVTDFDEFAVYDCRVKPDQNDKSDKARTKYYTYRQYAEKWDEIAGIFSKDAILKGSFDKYAESSKSKRGTAEVDSAFLAEIESWRDALAKNIALRNTLSVRELNESVQRIIDRVIFLRIAEDRGIEDYGSLRALCNGQNTYARLQELFYKADDRYNSGLFHFRHEKDEAEPPDNLTTALTIDDKPLKDILKRLYYPDSPYEFGVLPADILGQVYEQFLGKVIRLTSDHRAVVEDKPEVKKAGGVFYTPTYIVEYIVKNTLGKLLEGKTPKKVESLRILDPACGSGSFLLGAYQYLLDWHLQWYAANEPEKHAKARRPALYKGYGDAWQLTTAERKRILLNNIYGVDIDTQAVEVTKLSLLLKVLEGQTGETLTIQQKLFHERALPNLGGNIKCGNSLISPDFYDGKQMNLLDPEEAQRVNVFDWQAEFPEIFKAGGFDAVIGNPPWGATLFDPEQKYIQKAYRVAQGKAVDSYLVFIEAAFRQLKNRGILSYINPDTFLRKDDHSLAREFLLKNHVFLELIETGPVFSKVRDTWCLVSQMSKSIPTSSDIICHKKISRFVVSVEERLQKFGRKEWDVETIIPQSTWLSKQGLIIAYFASEVEQALIAKIELQPRLNLLEDKYRISRGEEGSKFDLKSDENGNFYVMIPSDIERYRISAGLKVTPETLTPTKVERLYRHPKIWIIRIQKMRWKQRLVCAFDERANSAGMKTLQIIVSPNDNHDDLKYLSGILASKIVNYWCVNYLSDDLNQSFLEKIPVCQAGTDLYRRMVSFVEQMLALHKRLAEAKTSNEQTIIQRQIDATDRQIDKLVYELYGLTSEEIAIVEGK